MVDKKKRNGKERNDSRVMVQKAFREETDSCQLQI